jgi:hypothetical protein
MADQPIFNEVTLRHEIERVWGAHGAHADVYDTLIKHNRNTNKLLVEALELIDGGIFPGKGKKRDALVAKVAAFIANPFMEV